MMVTIYQIKAIRENLSNTELIAKITAFCYLPEIIKREMIRQHNENHRKLMLSMHELKNASEAAKSSFDGFTKALENNKPVKEKSKRPRQWVNKFYSRQA